MADDFEALAASIRRVFPGSRTEPATEEQLAAIRRSYPDVPGHYLEFLRRVGWGSLGGSLMLYSGLCEPGEIFDEGSAAELPGLLFLGDNFGGWMVGFDTRAGWPLVEVDGSSLGRYPVEQPTLAAFIAQRIAEWQSAEPDPALDLRSDGGKGP